MLVANDYELKHSKGCLPVSKGNSSGSTYLSTFIWGQAQLVISRAVFNKKYNASHICNIKYY